MGRIGFDHRLVAPRTPGQVISYHAKSNNPRCNGKVGRIFETHAHARCFKPITYSTVHTYPTYYMRYCPLPLHSRSLDLLCLVPLLRFAEAQPLDDRLQHLVPSQPDNLIHHLSLERPQHLSRVFKGLCTLGHDLDGVRLEGSIRRTLLQDV